MKAIVVVAVSLLAAFASAAFAVEIEGVQSAALDQPRVNLHLRREPKGQPLVARKMGEQTINVQAFLDTGASGIMLSTTTADALGVKRAKAGEGNVVFHDVGVGGSDQFHVSEPLLIFLAPFGRTGEPDDADGYPLMIGPVRAQVGPLNGGLMQMLTGGMDVVGMPVMKGRVVVIDPRPVDTFGDTLRTGVYDRNGQTQIPKTDRHIALRYESFAPYTRTEPANATPPTLAENPFIDGVVVTMHNGKSTGNWLLDTGAAASMISSAQAAKVGVKYVEGTEGTDSPQLAGVPENEQFTLTIGGVGGTKKAAGFFLDTLVIATRENDPLIYKKAPVFVTDISVEDPKTKQKRTLDGVFGMNFLVASAQVTEAALMPDIGKLTAGPYDAIVFDEPGKVLGLKLKADLAREAMQGQKRGQIQIKPAKRR
jgi:predicted aspartyl protease